MIGLGVFHPGDSLLHRLPASAKLAGLAASAVALTASGWPGQGAAAGALVVGGLTAARLPIRLLLAGLRPFAWVVVFVAAAQAWSSGWEQAFRATAVMLALLLLATLVTLTTRTADIMDALLVMLRPLRRVGVDPERAALLLALSLRSVFTVTHLAVRIREAQVARGVRPWPTSFAAPLVVRSMRHADGVAEALVARGGSDSPPHQEVST
jgi:biotin transport system permease protein